MRHACFFALCVAGFAGCMTVRQDDFSVLDPSGNLVGDDTRKYMDIVETGAQRKGEYFIFWIRTAAPMPAASAFAEGQRVDFYWFVDADVNRTTGKSESGEDFVLRMWITPDGWESAVMPVSDIGEAVGPAPTPDQCVVQISGDTITLSVPVSTFPADLFEWWTWASTQNAPDWTPVTENPVTKRASSQPVARDKVLTSF